MDKLKYPAFGHNYVSWVTILVSRYNHCKL